jgi:hypothetical protein
MRPFLTRGQHNSPVFYIGVQGIACSNIESAAKWAWKNDLPFRRNFGLHGKTILPDLLFLYNSSSLRTKLEAIRNKVGYPEVWRDYSSVVIKPGDLLGNVERANAFEAKRQIVKIDKPLDRKVHF